MWEERGRKEGNPVHRFVSCHILMSPQRAVAALSRLTTSSLISGIDAPSSYCVFFFHRRKHPSCFIHNSDAYHTAAVCAVSTDVPSFFCSWIWLYALLCGFRYLPYWFYISWLISLVFISFSCLACAWSSFLCFVAPLSSAPARRNAPNHVCTTPCRFDQIHGAISCHLRTKRDRRLLLYLSHISGGRISIQFILT